MLKSAALMGLTAALLTGCGSLSPAGMIAAARLDPLTTSPRDISVAVSVPDALRLRDGDATLYLGYVPDDPGIAAPVAVTVPLAISDSAAGPRPPAAGETIYVLGVDAQAATRLSAAQDRIRALKAQDVAGEGTLSIAVGGGCFTRALNGRLPVATWVRTDPGAAFVPLLRGVDLFDELPPEERARLEAQLAPC